MLGLVISHLRLNIKLGGSLRCLTIILTKVGEERRLQLSKIEEIRAKVYESARSYKERPKLFHDRHILRNEFTLGMKVLLYDFKLNLFLERLRSR